MVAHASTTEVNSEKCQSDAYIQDENFKENSSFALCDEVCQEKLSFNIIETDLLLFSYNALGLFGRCRHRYCSLSLYF